MTLERKTDRAASAAPAYNFIEVFAGIGGMTLGFMDASGNAAASFAPRVLVDKDAEARSAFVRNHPGIRYLCADIHELSGRQIRDHAGMKPDEPLHVLVGGPPCQGFSSLANRALDDPRNAHVVDFLRLVKELKPRVAVMENVPQVITSHKGIVINEVCEGLAKLGYASCADILWASDFGVPQLRKRAFVVAYDRSLGIAPQFPPRTHERVPIALEAIRAKGKPRYDRTKLPFVSVEEAIGDLPRISAGEGDEVMFYSGPPLNAYQEWASQGSVAVFNHRSRAHTAEYLTKIGVIREGGRNQELPKGKRFSDNYYSQAYARLHRNGIAQTITTYFGNPGSGRFTHYSELRSITSREAARFQSFPDSFVFEGHHGAQMRHIGNAVPPLLARAIRDQIAVDLLGASQASLHGANRLVVLQMPEDPAQRSRVMRAVPSKHTSIEKLLRTYVSDAGIRGYRLHAHNVPGTPDMVFTRGRLAIFVDGCFWHGCQKCYREPRSNKEYWKLKVKRNRDRDQRVNAACAEGGWRVLRLWEHEVKASPRIATGKILRALKATTATSSRSQRRTPAKGRAMARAA